jgi:hypothetical protein
MVEGKARLVKREEIEDRQKKKVQEELDRQKKSTAVTAKNWVELQKAKTANGPASAREAFAALWANNPDNNKPKEGSSGEARKNDHISKDAEELKNTRRNLENLEH